MPTSPVPHPFERRQRLPRSRRRQPKPRGSIATANNEVSAKKVQLLVSKGATEKSRASGVGHWQETQMQIEGLRSPGPQRKGEERDPR
ncbi:hypothetical protein GW17_00006004 [Ensete ventricosum]|uniref:Uncharacterized protein n=1 Tax=Ensete ventricosum TaxID=4639 RepID=A0A444G3P9_ENSVE|nr:hypothetical protein B296_00006825 [Ensete ventricosum]RWW29467.1 hypothetical protein GW17_00006004 [Ensete ventricosum]